MAITGQHPSTTDPNKAASHLTHRHWQQGAGTNTDPVGLLQPILRIWLEERAATTKAPSLEEIKTTSVDIVAALAVLRDQVRTEIDRIELDLVDAARRRGVTWQELAPALGVSDRRAAERRWARKRAHRTDSDNHA